MLVGYSLNRHRYIYINCTYTIRHGNPVRSTDPRAYDEFGLDDGNTCYSVRWIEEAIS